MLYLTYQSIVLKDYIIDMHSHSYTELPHVIVIITCEIEILVITKLHN